MGYYSFDWDPRKDAYNLKEHGIPFALAQEAFYDSQRIIVRDKKHSTPFEDRFFCIGRVGPGILTVRFTYRNDQIRIFGAGYWRRERKIYETKNSIH
jgi:uncharacterized DUF497 family protein